MSIYVIDASAWLRLFLQDGPALPLLEQAASDVERGAASFAAPDLVLVEAGHALLRKMRRRQIRENEWRGIWDDMRRVPIDLVPSEDHMDEAFALAIEHNLSLYDALYLAVARHIGAWLYTADDALASAARVVGVYPRAR